MIHFDMYVHALLLKLSVKAKLEAFICIPICWKIKKTVIVKFRNFAKYEKNKRFAQRESMFKRGQEM
jgi:hypothetical protein